MKALLLSAMFALLLASSALAQTGPCSGGLPNPQFDVAFDPAVTLSFEHYKPLTTTVPQVTIEGHLITVTQFVPNPPPPVALCNKRTVALGALEPGAYHVDWKYREGLTGVTMQSFSFDFTVPAVDAPAAVVPLFDPRALAALAVVVAAAGAWALRR